ncbi:MAG: copper chaperone PCu(A)C [Gammaproteobacteria bacterium]|nr:copper chaperone PCu(A)C [Gammaproteobacteria bacterium]
MPVFRHLLFKSLLLAGVALMFVPAVAATDTVPFSVSHAWIRWLPGNLPLAGYATLENDTSEARILVAASSPAFKRIEFHRSMEMHGMKGMDHMMGGMSHMKHLKSVTVPAHGTFRFGPGAYHLMMWRSGDIEVGDHVPVTFRFSNGMTMTVEFAVRGPAG